MGTIFFRLRRTPRGLLVGLGNGLSKLWNLLIGESGKSSPAYLSTIRSAVDKAPDNLLLAELTSAENLNQYSLSYKSFDKKRKAARWRHSENYSYKTYKSSEMAEIIFEPLDQFSDNEPEILVIVYCFKIKAVKA